MSATYPVIMPDDWEVMDMAWHDGYQDAEKGVMEHPFYDHQIYMIAAWKRGYNMATNAKVHWLGV